MDKNEVAAMSIFMFILLSGSKVQNYTIYPADNLLILILSSYLFSLLTNELIDICRQANFEATLARETLLTSEEAVIAAAAAEAVALAKAAVKVAKDAAQLVHKNNFTKLENIPAFFSSGDETLCFRRIQFTETERIGILGDSERAEIGMRDGHSLQDVTEDADDLEPTLEELELLQAELSKSIAVRSNRQLERKARRERAAEKASASVVSLKSGSTSRRKRASLQEVDYADPLRYLRGTTSTSRLLTATEELELSEGIQVLLS